MDRIRTVIADDEPVIRDGIAAAIRRCADFEVVGECANGRRALDTIRREKPDVVFLDIQMPLLSGIQVVRALDFSPAPFVVFVTAYDDYAVPAFDVAAVDFLVKPFSKRRLNEALDRVRSRISDQRRLANPRDDDAHKSIPSDSDAVDSRSPVKRFVANDRGRRRLVDVESIFWVEAAGNYVRLHGRVRNSDAPHYGLVGSVLVRTTLRELVAALPAGNFRRIHRSHVVNVQRVREVRPVGSGDALVTLEDGTELPSSRTYRRERDSLLDPTVKRRGPDRSRGVDPRGGAGDQRGGPRDQRGGPRDQRGDPGELRGGAGDQRGGAGELRGGAGRLRGGAGELRGEDPRRTVDQQGDTTR